jgi:signal transduction histidine kinase
VPLPSDRSTEAALRDEILRLREELRLRDEFISTVGHELRNPLSPAFLAIDRLKDTLGAAEHGQVSVRVIEPQVEKLGARLSRFLEVLNRILDLSRLEAGFLDLVPERVDLVELIEDVVAGVERELSAARCQVTLTMPSTLVGHWDRMRVTQIVSNLLSNAIKYGAGQPLEISLAAEPGLVRFSIRDRGIGIAPADQERIFQRFTRVEAGARRTSFGVGLWIVRELCLAMGGSVAVESSLAQGSTFLVTLPRPDHDIA